MPWGAAAAATAVVAGSYMQGQSAKSAAETAAAQQREAGQLAAQYQQFRPVGITTGFGSSQFSQGPYGVESASYELTPEMKAIRDKLIAQAGAYDTSAMAQAAQPLMGAGQTLFGLGGQYLATSPEEARQTYMDQQRALLTGERERTLAGIRNKQLQTGRAGLATGGTSTGLAATNPEMAAYYNALAQQEAQLAAGAETAAQQRQAFGAGLYQQGAGLLGQVPALTSQGYGPLQTQLGLAGSIEEMGQQALNLGLQVGGQNAAAGKNAGNSLLQSGIIASKTEQAANAYSPLGVGLQGLGQSYLGGAFGGGAGGSTGGVSGGLGSWFNNYLTRQSNQASPDFVGPTY